MAAPYRACAVSDQLLMAAPYRGLARFPTADAAQTIHGRASVPGAVATGNRGAKNNFGPGIIIPGPSYYPSRGRFRPGMRGDGGSGWGAAVCGVLWLQSAGCVRG